MTTALKQPELKVEMLATGQIRPSPFNPRKNFKDVAELAANFRATGGIKVPLRVRPVEGDKTQRGYELVFGERRWRAAQVAELAEVPVIVEAMTDAQALELMLVELAQTSGVHPVEEAVAYKQLHEGTKESAGLSVEEIAAKVGKSESHVRGRIKLVDLAEPVRKAALAGDLPATHALLIARVPAKLQVEAMKAILGEEEEGPLTYRDAVALVHRKFMLALAGAPFDTADAELVKAAGSCTKCPKRTGNQVELFADVKSPDTCTDTTCFGSKVAAAAEGKLKAEETKGHEVLRGNKALSIFREDYNGNRVLGHDSGFVPLQPGSQYVPDRGYIDVAAAVKKDPKIKVVSVAHPDTGKLMELVPAKALPKVKEREFSNAGYNAAQKTRAANEKKRKDFAASLVAPLVQRAEKGIGKPELIALVSVLIDERAWNLDGVLERRAGKELNYAAAQKVTDALEKSLDKKTEAELRGWLCELVVTNRASAELAWKGEPEGNLAIAAAALGVDVKAAKKSFEAALKVGAIESSKRIVAEVKPPIVKKVVAKSPKPKKLAKAAKPKKGKKK